MDHEHLASHPILKPVALIADAILDVSRPNDIVLYPFAGWGTTVLAAEKTGLRAHAIEIDPRYCDVLVRRWQTYAGKAALHAETSLTFEEMAEPRRRPTELAGSDSPAEAASAT